MSFKHFFVTKCLFQNVFDSAVIPKMKFNENKQQIC